MALLTVLIVVCLDEAAAIFLDFSLDLVAGTAGAASGAKTAGDEADEGSEDEDDEDEDEDDEDTGCESRDGSD